MSIKLTVLRSARIALILGLSFVALKTKAIAQEAKAQPGKSTA